MGIVDVKQIPNSLWDQLISLNDLVQAVKSTDNLNEIVENIRSERDANKKQFDDLQALKAADDVTAKNLQDATAENKKSIDDLSQAQANADQAKTIADNQITKAATAQKLLAQAQADFDAKTQSVNDALATREKIVSDREVAARQAQSDANAMKDDYQSKLDNLKKLTG